MNLPTTKYIDKRYKDLIRKGFSSKQARDMVLFELGSSAIVREGIEAATAEDCMMVGRLVGTEIGATIGSLGRSLQSFGTGSFIGGSLGVYFGKDACSKIIRYASEKVVQKTSENLWTEYKDPLKEGIDTNCIAKHLTYNKTNNQKAIEYQKKSIGIPSKKQAAASGMIYVKGYTRSDGTEVKSYYRTRRS